MHNRAQSRAGRHINQQSSGVQNKAISFQLFITDCKHLQSYTESTYVLPPIATYLRESGDQERRTVSGKQSGGRAGRYKWIAVRGVLEEHVNEMETEGAEVIVKYNQ